MMKHCSSLALVVLSVGALGVALAADAGGKDAEQDGRLEALAKQVANLEALVGPDERALPGKPTIANRLDQLEHRTGQPAVEGQQRGAATDADLDQMRQQLRDLAASQRELAGRVSRLEESAGNARTDGNLQELRRDVERLQRDLETVRERLR
jgi:chromosome segregation ATPase